MVRAVVIGLCPSTTFIMELICESVNFPTIRELNDAQVVRTAVERTEEYSVKIASTLVDCSSIEEVVNEISSECSVECSIDDFEF